MKPLVVVLILNLILLIFFGLTKIKVPNKITPAFITLYFAVILGILALIAAVFPEGGIKLGGETKIQFATLDELFSSQYDNESRDFRKLKDIQNLSAEELAEQMVDATAVVDTIVDTIPPVKEKLSFLQLQFPDNDRTILYPAFRAFDQAGAASQPVRVLHYGDSQIEDDRISSVIRNELQKKFGGSGPGMIPVVPFYTYYPFSYSLEFSEGWYGYPFYWSKDASVEHKRYGALASFYQFTPYLADSLPLPVTENEAWVLYKGSRIGFPGTRTFQKCRLFYGYNKLPFQLGVSTDNNLLKADSFPATTGIQTYQLNFDEPISNLHLSFRGVSSPQIFGIALDGLNGVAVDNIAMRGNAGLIFTQMDIESLRKHYQALNIKMIILQFGGNIVPDVTDSYIAYYERMFCNQILRIKEALPDVSVVVIGVADMSVKVKTHFESYPKLDKIRDAMKRASFKAGAAYWDMYQAMGGKNSMPSWVKEDLGRDDYVHFTTKGAKMIATMFTGALLTEYNSYKKQTSKTEDPVP
ncbi:MAG: hypothetical protein JW801_09470 [Bacteroidales bacterium]|nr:hypothetical protein [Bacteroidales bacterium]